MESMSISELISSLKSSFKSSEYDAVAKILVQRDERKQQIIEDLKQAAESQANEKPPAASIEREPTVEEIYERLLRDDRVRCSEEENERLKKEIQRLQQQNEVLCAEKQRVQQQNEVLCAENRRLQQQNEVLCAENRTLQQQDEAQCACVEEMERRIAELEKGIESFKKDMVRAQEKGGVRQNTTVKLRRVLEFDDLLYSSAAKKTKFKENEAIPGEVVEIVDSDNECVVPNKDHDIAVGKKTTTEDSTDAMDLHTSSRRSLNDFGVLEKCQMLNVHESAPSLIKSPRVGASQSNSSVKKGKLWKFDGELAADLTKNDILCMEAVCALHKHRVSVEESLKNTSGPKLNQLREATILAEFLTNGDPDHRLKRSVAQLGKHERRVITKCRAIAVDFSKELFELYRKHEDLFASKL